MNLNIITSFIIAGILLLMLAYMNSGVGKNAAEVVLSQSKQSQKLDIQKIISYDFPKIGYDSNNSLDTLISFADSDRIKFYSNIDNSANGSIETITWEYTDDEIPNTANEDDRVLKRIVDGNENPISIGITGFEIAYFDTLGGNTPMAVPIPTSNLSSIRQIEITLTIQNADKIENSISGNLEYITTQWVKRFTPRNLQQNL